MNHKDYMKKTVFGVGYLGGNEVNSLSSTYKRWQGMLRRCYTYTHRPTYKDCEVCIEWHNFQTYAKWEADNHVEGYQVDKDLLGSGKLYSPKTCCWLPPKINMALVFRSKVDLPIGVRMKKGKYYSEVSCNGVRKGLGYRATAEEAGKDYRQAKEAYVKNFSRRVLFN